MILDYSHSSARTYVRRVLLSTILTSVAAVPAQAGPLLFTFEGTIPTLNKTTTVFTFTAGGTTTVSTPSVMLNVPVSGSFTFDSDVWTRVGAPFTPDFPVREFTVTDPANAAPALGVETPELIRGSLEVGGGVGTLNFDRSLIGTLPSGATVTSPYFGSTTMRYLDGSEGLNVGPFEFFDSVSFAYFNSFAWADFTGPPSSPGDVVFRSEGASISLLLNSGYNSSFELQNLFPAGPPLAFLFNDPVPGSCGTSADCADGLGSFGNFFAFSGITTLTADGAIGVDTSVTAERMIVNRAELRAVAAPEPASLALLSLGAAALGFARRRNSR